MPNFEVQGMQYILEQAFLNIEGIGSRIAKAEYDLVNSDGAVIIPHLWETFVEPDMLVKVHLWPNSSPQMQYSLPAVDVVALVHPPPLKSPSRPPASSRRSSPPPPRRHTSPPPRRPTTTSSSTTFCCIAFLYVGSQSQHESDFNPRIKQLQTK
jgi:hypothetical protein